MLQCTGLSYIFKPLAVASLMYRHSVPLVLFRLGVCCCLRRDVDARNVSGRVLRGDGRNHTKLHWACVRSESSSRQRCLLLAKLLYCSSRFRIVTSVPFSQLSLNFNTVYWDLVLLLKYYYYYSAQRQVLHCKRRNLGCSSAECRPSTTNSGTKVAVLPGIE